MRRSWRGWMVSKMEIVYENRKKVCPIISDGTTLTRCLEDDCMAWVPAREIPNIYKKSIVRTYPAYCKLMEAHECNME
jgi:hypothetical protein